MIRKILIANRGEIALRIIKTLNKLGKTSVAVYADNDKDLPFVKAANIAISLGSGNLNETYLNTDKIMDIAIKQGVDAIHPGYGFLSENSDFVSSCHSKGIVFIGPDENAVKLMGNKIESRNFVEKLNIPLTQSVTGAVDDIIKQSNSIKYPVMVKPAMGGGGKGMAIVHSHKELKNKLESASRQSQSYFGDNEVFIEQYIPNARHIEVQVLGDGKGNVVHLFDRECSLQRRYQKVIEEAPSPSLDENKRREITEATVKIASAIKYRSAGTIEFILNENGEFYFLEMNTRIQVEHPVTEAITGIDIVEQQLKIAEGDDLLPQDKVVVKSHAIEARIYAEDPWSFMPSPGKINIFSYPKRDNVRMDVAIEAGNSISSDYDPMIAKLIVSGVNRTSAVKQLKEVLDSLILAPCVTNINFLQQLVISQDFIENNISTKYIEDNLSKLRSSNEQIKEITYPKALALAMLIKNGITDDFGFSNSLQTSVQWEDKNYRGYVIKLSSKDFMVDIYNKEFVIGLKELNENSIVLDIDSIQFVTFYSITENEIIIQLNGIQFNISKNISLPVKITDFDKNKKAKQKFIESPIHGKVIKLNVSENSRIEKGETLLVIESMKMENNVLADADAVVKSINVRLGQQVDTNTVLLTFN